MTKHKHKWHLAPKVYYTQYGKPTHAHFICYCGAVMGVKLKSVNEGGF